jgi:hypothetical protein
MKQMPGSLILFVLLVSLLMATNCLADTGTYRIIDYSVTLNPKANGEIVMDYSQTWQVTGGNIPWVTVGLSNANYQIVSWGGVAKTISNGNEGSSWYGARVDLKKIFLPNEFFTYNFTIIQRNLLDQRSDGYWIVFTPGWYDRCSTEKLSIKVVSPIDLKNVTTDPKPVAAEGRTLIFSKNNLGMGDRYKISIKFPKNAFFKMPAQAPESGMGIPTILFWLILLVIVFGLAGIVYWANKDDSSSASYSYHDYSGPIVSSGSIRRRIRSLENHSSGGSGAFGGRAISCACVSCACACACACAGGGGGGAGCAKKWLHSCKNCDDPQYSLQLDTIRKEEIGDGKWRKNSPSQ